MQSTSPRSRGRRSRSGAVLGGSSAAGILFLDMFRRIPREYRTSSYLGGVLSAACAAVLTVLVLLELQAYLTVTYTSAVVFPGNGVGRGVPGTAYQPYVSLRFNVTFPHLPCEYMSAEMFDVYGRHAITNTSVTPERPSGDEKVSMTIFKWRVVDEGRKRAGSMQQHVEPTQGGKPVHEELPYHHAAHQYRDVVPLTVANFDTFVQSKDVVMVDFYAPWCIWCQRLAPVWENFAHEVGTKDYADFVGVAKVDCTTETPLCTRRRIQGYPSIFLYRDRNPHSHTAYRGDRTTQAFLNHIEGLGVETDHRQEIQDIQDEVQREIEAEERVVARAAAKKRDDRPDTEVNHPLKSLTAPDSLSGDAGMLAIMRALAGAGGSQGAQGGIRVFSGNGGNIRVISVRRIPTAGQEDEGGRGGKRDKNKPLEFHTKLAGGEFAGKPAAPQGKGEEDGGITVKVLPSAKDKLEAAKKKEQEVARKGTATVPKPKVAPPKDAPKAAEATTVDGDAEVVAAADGESLKAKSKKVESIAVVADKAAEIADVARKAKLDAKKAEEDAKPVNGGGSGNRRRRLLGVEEEGEGEGAAVPQKGPAKTASSAEEAAEAQGTRVADSEVESRAELFKNTKDVAKRQKLWNELVLPLPKDQQRKFTALVGGKDHRIVTAASPEEVEADKMQEPVAPPHVLEDKSPISKTKPELAAKEDATHITNTEGCLVYGAIVAEKVPATIRFQAKSKWHNFVSHHVDMSHRVHDFTFGDLTHKLQVRRTTAERAADTVDAAARVSLSVQAADVKSDATHTRNIYLCPYTLHVHLTQCTPNPQQAEFAHIKFHQFEGTKMMTSLAPKEYISAKAKATHHHYMRVVGTHVSILGMAEDTTTAGGAAGENTDELFQYTATSQQYHDTEHLPSAKFTFDFDPMLLTLKEDAVPLHKFLTSLMAIVGGVVVVFSMLNALLQNAIALVSGKRR